MFGRATIRLGIGPHSSFLKLLPATEQFEMDVKEIQCINFVKIFRTFVWSNILLAYISADLVKPLLKFDTHRAYRP